MTAWTPKAGDGIVENSTGDHFLILAIEGEIVTYTRPWTKHRKEAGRVSKQDLDAKFKPKQAPEPEPEPLPPEPEVKPKGFDPLW